MVDAWSLRRVPDSMVRVASRLRAQLHAERARRRLEPVVIAMARQLWPADPAANPATGDSPSFSVLSASADKAVLIVDHDRHRSVVMKVGWSEQSSRSMGREASNLLRMHREFGERPWVAMVPRLLGQGQHDRFRWMAQSAMPGVTTEDLDLRHQRSIQRAAEAIAPVHRDTATTIGADRVIARLIDEPIATVRAARPRFAAALDQVQSMLREELVGRDLIVATVHGDLTPPNVLLDPESTAVVALVDWELSEFDTLPELDLATYVLALSSELSGQEHGRLIADRLAGTPSVLDDVLATAAPLGPNRIPLTTAITLAWLHHASANLSKSSGYGVNPIWLSRNIDVVLESLDRIPPDRLNSQVTP